jgi:hypothetical protein
VIINAEKGTWNNPFQGTPHEARVFCTGFIIFCTSILTAAFGALLKFAPLLYIGTAMLIVVFVIPVYAGLTAVVRPPRVAHLIPYQELRSEHNG